MSNKRQWDSSIIILSENENLIYLDASTEDALYKSSLSILRERLNKEIFKEQEFITRSKRIISKKNGKLAWELLQERSSMFIDESIKLEKFYTKHPTESE